MGGEAGEEEKKIYDRIQHAPYSLDLAPFDFAFFPQLKSNLHGKRFSDFDELRTESDLKKTWFGDGFNNTGTAYKP